MRGCLMARTEPFNVACSSEPTAAAPRLDHDTGAPPSDIRRGRCVHKVLAPGPDQAGSVRSAPTDPFAAAISPRHRRFDRACLCTKEGGVACWHSRRQVVLTVGISSPPHWGCRLVAANAVKFLGTSGLPQVRVTPRRRVDSQARKGADRLAGSTRLTRHSESPPPSRSNPTEMDGCWPIANAPPAAQVPHLGMASLALVCWLSHGRVDLGLAPELTSLTRQSADPRTDPPPLFSSLLFFPRPHTYATAETTPRNLDTGAHWRRRLGRAGSTTTWKSSMARSSS